MYVSISDEGSLPEIALSGASNLALILLFLIFSRSVHVFYTEIDVPHLEMKYMEKRLCLEIVIFEC